MNYTALKTRLQEPDVADLSDAEAAAALNAETIDVLVPIPSSELLAFVGAEGRYAKLETAAAAEDLALRSIGKAALLLIQRDGTTLDLSLPDRAGMVDALVAAGVFTEDDKTALYAKATGKTSWAAQAGVGRVRNGDVAHARSI